jgi:hypothetical protein
LEKGGHVVTGGRGWIVVCGVDELERVTLDRATHFHCRARDTQRFAGRPAELHQRLPKRGACRRIRMLTPEERRESLTRLRARLQHKKGEQSQGLGPDGLVWSIAPGGNQDWMTEKPDGQGQHG